MAHRKLLSPHRILVLTGASLAALLAAAALRPQRTALAASNAAPAASALPKPTAAEAPLMNALDAELKRAMSSLGSDGAAARPAAQALLPQLRGCRRRPGRHRRTIRRHRQLQPAPPPPGRRPGAPGQPRRRQHPRRPPHQRAHHHAAAPHGRPRRHRALALVRHQPRLCPRARRLS